MSPEQVLPAPAAPVMSCRDQGGRGAVRGISSSQLSGISDRLWTTTPVAPSCEPSTHSLCQEVHNLTPDT